jgi:hypothetical protein
MLTKILLKYCKPIKYTCVWMLMFVVTTHNIKTLKIIEFMERDSKRWTQFRTSIFPELYMVCE